MNFTLNNLAKTSINWLFPHKCLICSEIIEHPPYCEQCYSTLPFYYFSCSQCGQPLFTNYDYCGRCIESPPWYDACFCPFEYQGTIKKRIQEFKYQEKPELALNLANLLSIEIQAQNINLPDLIIPVPTHTKGLQTRGYNQALLIAKKVAKNLGVPIAADFVIKHKNTEKQASQTLKKRQTNLRNSFKVEQYYAAKSIAIIDDVITSGATVNEISKTLKKKGVHYIQVWAIAHTKLIT